MYMVDEWLLQCGFLGCFSNKVTTRYLEFVFHFWILVETMWWAQLGFLTWRLSLPQSRGTEWEADSGGEWTASSGKGVCCEPSVCIKHVDLNNLLLLHSLSTVEFKGYPMFPQEAEIVQSTIFFHFISLSLTFFYSLANWNRTSKMSSYQVLNLCVLGKIGIFVWQSCLLFDQ